MVNNIVITWPMSIEANLIKLRRERNLTQQQLADLVGLHVNQIRRYESGQAQPSIESLKKIALNLHVSTDQLLFDEGERGPVDDELKLKFEAVQRLDIKEREAVRTLIDGVLLMEDAKRYTARAS